MTTALTPIDLMLTHPLLRSWRELRGLIKRLDGHVPSSWELPTLVSGAFGGDARNTVPAVAALGAAQMAIIAIDDMLDRDPEGIYRTIGAGPAANLASALQAVSLDLLDAAGMHTEQARHALNTMISQTAYGQALDISNPQDEDEYWSVVRYKSSPFYSAAFTLGALAAAAPEHTVKAAGKLGALYGEMIQIHDDLKDALGTPANPDWIEGRNSLPLLFAAVVDHPERARFLALREDIEAAGNLGAAQDILVRCGAISYCLDQLVQRFERAQAELHAIDAVHPAPLRDLFTDLVEPMKELLETGGMPLPPALAALR